MYTIRVFWPTMSVAHSTHETVAAPRYDVQSRKAESTGDLIVDPGSRELLLHGELVELTRTEFDLLLALSRHPRQVFTPAQLFAAAWEGEFFEADHVIETHICRLRHKLGESGSHPRYIHTVRGVGYRFEPDPLPAG